jgi:hypothetical protein
VSASFKPTRTELQEVQRIARLTEMHAEGASDCASRDKPGAWLAHDGLAREYSAKAFALSRSVQERSA